MTQPHIAVLGAGANGASIGADLVRAGHDVTLIEQWPSHVEAMREKGITINTPGGSWTVPVRVRHLCEVATLREKFDIVLVLVKAYDTKWSVQLIEPYLAPGAIVVGVQNGMTLDDITDVVGIDRTMGAVIEITSAMFEPGVVERHSPHDRSWFAVGSVGGATRGREEEIACLLHTSGAVEIVNDIRAVKWMKIVSNATTLVTTAIVGLPMVEANRIAEMRDLMIRSGNEALAATLTLGNPILPIFGLGQNDLLDESLVTVTLLDTLLEGFVMPTSITTILQDWKKLRRSEVDNINGLVAETLARHVGGAPVNQTIVDFAHRIERGELEPGIHLLEPLLSGAGI
ncbi:MAG: ketopantoate reductase family protein [Acidimicrobiaceae bacterium]|nr:ketopantoate reductase family protein [Acidimicrobiaceae bacterium]